MQFVNSIKHSIVGISISIVIKYNISDFLHYTFFRSQLKQAVVKMVQECCTYVDKTPDKETKIKLIETLRTITEGKIYVEVERARLTHILAKIREEENNVAEAAKIIQELQVKIIYYL